MRKLIVTALAVLATTMSPAFAEKISVVTEEMAPYNFTDEKDKQITGLSTEVVKEVLKRAKVDHEIKSFPWSRAYKMAQEDPDVAIYSIGRNEEREKMFKWVGVVAKRDVYLYKLKSRTDIKASKLEDLKPYNFGGIRDGIRTMYLVKEGFKVEQVTDDISNIKKLQAGRIDGIPSDDLALIALAKNSGVEFDSLEKLIKIDKLSGGLSMAFSLKTSDETVEKCRVALDSMVKDGTFDAIAAKWHHK